MFIYYLQPYLGTAASYDETTCNLIDKNQISNTSATVNHTTRCHVSERQNRNIAVTKIWNLAGLLVATLEFEFYTLFRVGSS
jgi:hypothetical protein